MGPPVHFLRFTDYRPAVNKQQQRQSIRSASTHSLGGIYREYGPCIASSIALNHVLVYMPSPPPSSTYIHTHTHTHTSISVSTRHHSPFAETYMSKGRDMKEGTESNKLCVAMSLKCTNRRRGSTLHLALYWDHHDR
ncbi:hypothetical protein LOAG_04657 [Loa loa]|uniref:Uncharacterized protein n=1 Tax=Loa loa TaxID=7209 RepID=A0A1S0U3I5_LOALO|nr:hypothetical protein LOAG_04657 [Loa loa]EFO23826.1 hypothetical protein LOAG_04657 [Loa loa]